MKSTEVTIVSLYHPVDKKDQTTKYFKNIKNTISTQYRRKIWNTLNKKNTGIYYVFKT